MLKSVYFSVEYSNVVCDIDGESYTCETSEDIVTCLKQNNVTSENCDVFCSSSVDFCEDDSMEPGQAEELIDDALTTMGFED